MISAAAASAATLQAKDTISNALMPAPALRFTVGASSETATGASPTAAAAAVKRCSIRYTYGNCTTTHSERMQLADEFPLKNLIGHAAIDLCKLIGDQMLEMRVGIRRPGAS